MTSVTPDQDQHEATAPRVERAEPQLLGIYLNDHLAMATGMAELGRRLLAARRTSPIGGELADIVGVLVADRDRYAAALRSIGAAPSRLKTAGGWLGERAGRLKLNGHLRTRSPMSTMVELEGLATGIAHSLAGWRTVATAAARDPRLSAEAAEEALQALRSTGERVRQLSARVGADVFG